MDTSDAPAGPNSGRLVVLVTLLRWAAWIASAAVLAFVAVCYWGRFDACTVVTLFPVWCWALVGVVIGWLAFSRRRWIPTVILAAGWLAFLVAFSDSPMSLVRGWLSQTERGQNLRVVSLNCAGAGAAARAVRPFDPDIVLVQESPSADVLNELATEMYGSSANLVRGVDASILARGRVREVHVPREFMGNFVHARVERDGTTINVISLRLWPCPVRLDLWSPDCWHSYQLNRETRRGQLAQVANYIATLQDDEPLVVGGDFNCPPGDAVFRLLEPLLADSFPVAGRGWGATIIELAGWPLIRIDQIWTSRQLRPVSVFAHRAYSSDHHMVIGDFSLDAR